MNTYADLNLIMIFLVLTLIDLRLFRRILLSFMLKFSKLNNFIDDILFNLFDLLFILTCNYLVYFSQ